MQSAIFNTPVLKVNNLKTKFDTIVLSNSFVALIGDYIEARIVQQLHYWCYSEYGVVIKGLRWIYKPIREWLSEAFIGFTDWQLRKAIASLLKKGLIKREKLYVKHHQQEHNSPWWNPKNQTYYYNVNYGKLQQIIEQVENAEARPAHGEPSSPSFLAETTENVRIENDTKLSVEEFQDTKSCEYPQNNTENTSIKNNSRELSLPHLPCVGKEKEKNNQNKQELSNSELPKIQEIGSVNPEVIEEGTNVGQVEENINWNKSTNVHLAQPNTEQLQKSERPSPKLKVTKTRTRVANRVRHAEPSAQSHAKHDDGALAPQMSAKQKRENKAPWQDELQRSEFYRALIQALPIVANSHSPQGLAKTIIAQLKSGEEHTYWDDFAANLPIGTSTKPEWEIEPGVPYPMFIEYLIEKIKRGNNTQTTEQARNEVFRILSQPRQATAFWGQFKRSVVNTAEQVERDRTLGVSNPNTPVWTRERIEPSIEEAERAGKKIVAVNGATQAAIESARTPQLESKDSVSVPQSLSSATSASQNKSEQVSSSPDPWNEDDKPESDKPENDKPTLSMREMLAARGVKGFCKPMPKVSQAEAEAEERKQAKPKTNIAQMSLTEINDYLKDPVLQKQLTPQLFHSDYELITDYLGQIIGVKLSEVQIQKRQSQSTGE